MRIALIIDERKGNVPQAPSTISWSPSLSEGGKGVCANIVANIARDRRGRRPRRPVWHNGVCANNAATSAFPKEGKVSGSCPTDEDVGTLFAGNFFDVRLRAGVYHP